MFHTLWFGSQSWLVKDANVSSVSAFVFFHMRQSMCFLYDCCSQSWREHWSPIWGSSHTVFTAPLFIKSSHERRLCLVRVLTYLHHMRAVCHIVLSACSITYWVIYPAALFAAWSASLFPLATNKSALSCPLHLITASSLSFIKASTSFFYVFFMLDGGSTCHQKSWSDPLTRINLGCSYQCRCYTLSLWPL